MAITEGPVLSANCLENKPPMCIVVEQKGITIMLLRGVIKSWIMIIFDDSLHKSY